MQDLRDIGQLDTGLPADLAHAVEHTDGLVMRSGCGFRTVRRPCALIDEQDIGEGAADIDPETVGHAASSYLRVTQCMPRMVNP